MKEKNKIIERTPGENGAESKKHFLFAVGVMGKLHSVLFVGLLEIAPPSQAGNLTPWRGGFERRPGATEAGSPIPP